MKKYLFIIFDRYEAQNSEKFQIQSILSPKELFKQCMIHYANFEKESYEDEVAEEVFMNSNHTAWDSEEKSYLLTELES